MSSSFIVRQVGTHPIWHVTAPTRQTLALTFMRMQECYESPAWSGKIFTHDEYIAWYANTYGAFTYARDWGVASMSLQRSFVR